MVNRVNLRLMPPHHSQSHSNLNRRNLLILPNSLIQLNSKMLSQSLRLRQTRQSLISSPFLIMLIPKLRVFLMRLIVVSAKILRPIAERNQHR